MAMTIGEANAVVHVVQRLLGMPRAFPHNDARLIEDLRELTARAGRVLMAGPRPDDVEEAARRWLIREMEQAVRSADTAGGEA